MRYKITLLLVLLGWSFNVFGVDLCQSGGIKTKTSSPNKNEFPGILFWEQVFNNGTNHESKFHFPCDWSGADNSEKISYSLTVGNKTISTIKEENFKKSSFLRLKRGALIGYGENTGGKYPSAVQFNKVCLTTSVEWSYNTSTWYCMDNLVTSTLSEDCNKSGWEYNQHYSFNEESLDVYPNELWSKISDNSAAIKEYNDKGTITIYFRFVYYVELEYRKNRHDEGEDGKYSYRSAYIRQPDNKWCSITINRCDAGTLSIVNDGIPALNGDVKNGYAIYAKSDVEENFIEVTLSSNVARYSSLGLGDMSFIDSKSYVCYYKKANKLPLNGEFKNDIVLYVYPEDIGKAFSLQRNLLTGTIDDGEVYCKSNTIDLKVLRAPYLDGIDVGSSEKIVCPTTGNFSPNDSIGSIDKDMFLTLEGNKCDFGEFEKYESTYGVEYGWRYYTDKNSTLKELPIKNANDNIGSDKLFDYNNDNNGPNLILPIFALDPKRTYYFEQYVKFKNFSDAWIEAAEDVDGGIVKSYTVRVSKSLVEDKLKLEVNPKESCFGENLENVIFKAEYEDANDFKNYGINDEKGFKFEWTIDGTSENSYGSVSQKRAYTAKENHCMNVSLADGCGNTIKKEVCMEVHDLPAFSAENIKSESANVSLTYETDPISGEVYVLVKGLKGKQFNLSISDEEKSLFNYYYGPYDDGTYLTSISASTYKNTISSYTLYFYKEAKNGYKCLSNPVKVKISDIDDIQGNEFGKTSIYVCPGSKVPALNTQNITDPVMGDADFKYSWQYSTNGIDWKEMINTSDNGTETKFTDKNYDGSWEGTVSDGKLYIRRAVKAYINEVEVASGVSNSLEVSVYASPNPKLTVTSQNTNTIKCHGEEVTLSMTVNPDLLNQQKVMQESQLKDYGYYDYSEKNYKEIKSYTEITDHVLELKNPKYEIYAGVNYCGSIVYSKGQSLSTYDKLDVTPAVSACKVVGQDVTIKASGEDLDCVISGSSVKYPDETDKSVATILLEKKQLYTYKVDIENTTTGCKSSVTKTIQDNEIKDKLSPKNIGPNGNPNEKVCAGEEVSLFSNTHEDQIKNFAWSVDSVYIKNGNDERATYNFSIAGQEYEVAREWDYYVGDEKCYSVIDKVTVSTYPKVEIPTLEVSNSKICNGEDIKLTATAVGGGSESSYIFTLMPTGEVSSEKVAKGRSTKFDEYNLTKETSFYVIAEDNNCSANDNYKTQSEKVTVEVEKNLDFKITSTKSVITRDEFKDGVISVPVTFEGIQPSETLYYTLGDGDETKVVYPETGGLSIKMDESLFDNDKNTTTLVVRRIGSVLSSCTSAASKNFGVNDGFEGVPSIVGNGQDQEIEVCGGSDVELVVDNADKMNFADNPISSMENATWTWFKDNSVVAKTTTPDYTVQAGIGKTNIYTVTFSGEDSDGTKRRVSSNEFIVKGKSGIEVGRIAFGGDYSSQNFIEFCNNKESEQKISMTCELDPKLVDFTWMYSTTGAPDTWKEVPATWNGQESTKSKVITLNVDSLVFNGNETYYFQVEAKDNCDNVSVTTSDNMLQVKIKKNVELPVVKMISSKIYSSADVFPSSLDFSRKNTHANLYEFVGWGETEDLGGTSQRVLVSDLHFGENSVGVVRTELARISNEECISDTLHYTFNIYQKLATPKLATTDPDISCPNNKVEKYFTLNGIKGGDPSTYSVAWQYKLDEESDWLSIENGDNLGLFTADILKLSEIGKEIYSQSIAITNQSQSIIVRAIVSCDKNNYPGDYVVSNEVAMEVYAPLKDNDIDRVPQEICYNTAIDTIRGYAAEGGSGRYSYTWWSSEDKQNFERVVKGEDWEPFFAPRNFGGQYNLTKTTYFKRIVTDTVCKTTLESETKSIWVRDSFNILTEDVDYSRIITNDARAEFTGVSEYDEYIWWKSETKEYDKSAANVIVKSDPLSVPDGDDFMTVTYYVQAVKDGCRSVNKLPMEIYVYNQTGGHIFFEDQDSKPNAYWICSGERDVEILSDDYARNGSFLWYCIVGGQQKAIKGVKEGLAVSTPEINLDTTNLELTNSSGQINKIQIFRKTTVNIEGKNESLWSDTLTINIVPTLQSISNAKEAAVGESLAGTLEIEGGGRTKYYCIGDEPDMILGRVNNEELSDLWDNYKNYFGPWLYDKKLEGGFTTYMEYQKDGGEWVKGKAIEYSEQSDYAARKGYYVPTASISMDGSYIVRRVIDDGCSSVSSNEIKLILVNAVVNPDTIKTYAYMPVSDGKYDEKNPIKQGYEIGDSLVFESQDKDLSLVWFADAECTDTLSGGRRYGTLVLTEEIAEMLSSDGAYIYVKAKEEDCYGEAVEIPFAYGTTSDGGKIGIIDTIICKNDTYSDIYGIKPANGYYIAPKNVAMKWTYAWQFKRTEKGVWSNIEGVTEANLSAEKINNLVAMSISETSPLIIRRVATNEKGRVRYSNVITLVHYDDFVPGELSLTTETSKFCTYDELGFVKTTSAKGGRTNGRGIYKWEYNINGKDWHLVENVDSLYLGYVTDIIEDNSINNVANIKCVYYDLCDTVESEPVEVVFYRRNNIPSIYQNNDSCSASLVNLVVYKEEVKKTYIWNYIYVDPLDTTYTENIYWHTGGDSLTIYRTQFPTGLYAINSVDDETNCVSDYYYFNVDSLPELTQTVPDAPSAICAGSDLEIKGGTLSGGNGEKSFQWQISLTGKEDDFSDIVDAINADLELQSKFMKTPAFFRRIVVDMCETDTSEVVYVGIREKVSVSPEDLVFDDFKCPNGIFSAIVVAEKDTLYASEYWTLGQETITESGKKIQMEGFVGDSMEFAFIHFVTDSNGVTCQSEEIKMMAHNKPSINKEENVISTENFIPCNESLVKIKGTKLGGVYSDKISYSWYVNDIEQIGNFDSDLRFRANDDMFVKRVANNGCVTDTSNVLHLEGQMVFRYDYETELEMEVVSNVADSSVTMNILGSKKFSEGYYFDGDGELPAVTSNSIVFPYKYDAYKNTILEIYANQTYCVTPYAIKPIRGGVISFDGDMYICGSDDIKPIVATELEGVSSSVTYQWQYKNDRTPDFINIEGATNKSYTPSAIDIATTYRRVATEGVYKSISNELTMSIRPLPSVAKISADIPVEDLKEMGLSYSQNEYYQWIPNAEVMLMSLVDSASNADHTYWQKSYDNIEWTLGAADTDSMVVKDSTSVVYYRFVAESACGADTSSIVRLLAANIEPITDAQINWNETDTFVCKKSNRDPYLKFKLHTTNTNKIQGEINQRYLYSYRAESSVDLTVAANTILKEDNLLKSTSLIRIYELDEKGNLRIPGDDVTLYVTRHDTVRGLSVTRAVTLKVDAFDASYAMSIENEPEIRVGENSVNEIQQGNRVRFIPIVTSNKDNVDISYNWVLEEPLNKSFFNIYSGRNGIDGLTSERKEPTCYYYNGGRYPVSLTISDGFCSKTVRDTSLYISEATTRSYTRAMMMEDDFLVYGNEMSNPLDYRTDRYSVEFIDVYPTLVTDVVNVNVKDKKDHKLVLTDESGKLLYSASFSGSAQLYMNGYISRVFFIVVDDWYSFKLIKK